MPLEIFDEVRPRKEERAKLRWSVLLGIVCLIALFIAAAWPTQANAEPVTVYSAEQDGVRLRLLDAPCTDNTSLMLISTAPVALQSGWRASSSDWRMQSGQWETFSGCWLEVSAEEAGAPDAVFVFVFSDRTTGSVLKRDFLKKRTGA